MSDDLWKMATGYKSPDEANAALVNQAEEIASLRAALRPFAELAKACVERADARGFKDHQSAVWTPQNTRFVEATFADCRALLKALEGK